jgi:hypothetical protein
MRTGQIANSARFASFSVSSWSRIDHDQDILKKNQPGVALQWMAGKVQQPQIERSDGHSPLMVLLVG